jgi:hypothetical protein
MPIKRVPFLEPGTYRLPGGRTVTHTPASIRKLVAQGNAQVAAGLRIPCAWMHDPDALPQYLSHLPPGTPAPHADEWMARHWFGDVRKFEAEPGGGAVALVDIPDPQDAKQFSKVGQVSPGLYQDWVDERNVLWPSLSVGHIACTPKPVHRGLPRPTDAHPQLFSHPVRARAVYWLSFPATPRSDPMADETDDTEFEGGEGESKIDIAEVIALLKKLDIHGLEDVTEDTLVAALKAAVHTKLGEAEGDEGESPDGDEGTEAVPAPMLMSHPVVKALLKRNGDLEHRQTVAEVNALLADGKVGKDLHKRLTDEVQKQFMSQPAADQFNPDGTRKPTALDIRIAAYADLPKGKFHQPQFMGHAPAGTHPVPNPQAESDRAPSGLRPELEAELRAMGLTPVSKP